MPSKVESPRADYRRDWIAATVQSTPSPPTPLAGELSGLFAVTRNAPRPGAKAGSGNAPQTGIACHHSLPVQLRPWAFTQAGRVDRLRQRRTPGIMSGNRKPPSVRAKPNQRVLTLWFSDWQNGAAGVGPTAPTENPTISNPSETDRAVELLRLARGDWVGRRRAGNIGVGSGGSRGCLQRALEDDLPLAA